MSRFLKVMIVLLTIAAFATPAIAADGFSVYGQARTGTWYTDLDVADTSNFTMDLLNTSRFGMKASKGAVSGQYEINKSGDLRLLYGAYKLDAGTLSIGQQYNAFTPASFSKVNAGNDSGGGYFGFISYTIREVSFKFAMNNGFSVYLVRNTTQSATDDAVMPRLEASYKGKAGDFSYTVAAGYKNHQLNANDDLDAFLVSFIGNIPVGPIAIKFNANYGVNAKEYGNYKANVAGNANDDADLMSGFIQASFKANDSNLFSAGVLFAQEDRDDLADPEQRIGYFIQDQITIAPGFTVSPEITYVEYNDFANGNPDDEQLYVGAKWQVNF